MQHNFLLIRLALGIEMKNLKFLLFTPAAHLKVDSFDSLLFGQLVLNLRFRLSHSSQNICKKNKSNKHFHLFKIKPASKQAGVKFVDINCILAIRFQKRSYLCRPGTGFTVPFRMAHYLSFFLKDSLRFVKCVQ
jgi:hypothetical protein